MNKNSPNPELPGAIPEGKGGFDFLELVIILVRYKWIMTCLPLAFAAVAAVVSLSVPETFRSSAKVLPPQQAQSGAGAILAQLGAVSGAVAGAAGLKSPADIYIAMLKSRTIADRLVASFELKKVYDTESNEKAVKILAENTFISTGKDGLILVDVEDKNKERVALITNAYISELVKLTSKLALTEAAQRRLFYEGQLKSAKDNLSVAESTLKNNLDTRGVANVEASSRAVSETAARLRAQISAKDIQLKSMTAFVTTDNQEYIAANQELKSMRKELSRLENGGIDDASSAGSTMGLESVKSLRDVKYYQMLYDLLAKQYEIARLDEAKDSAVIQVLDPGLVPERRFKPKVGIITILAFIIGLFFAIFVSIVKNFRATNSFSAQRAEQLHRLKSVIRF